MQMTTKLLILKRDGGVYSVAVAPSHDTYSSDEVWPNDHLSLVFYVDDVVYGIDAIAGIVELHMARTTVH